MPKRPSAAASGSGDANMSTYRVPQRSERSHSENQERAYIAASRRSDRSIEARVQSAHMASMIHRKRTGKGFRISEEIVAREEMYEEEEDNLPRSYRLLGPNVHTASAEMNSKVEAYLANKVAMASLLAKTNDEWRQNEINKLFAQSFPDADQHARRLSQNIQTQPYPRPVQSQSPMSPTFEPVGFQQGMGRPTLQRTDSATTSSLSPTTSQFIGSPAGSNTIGSNLGSPTAPQPTAGFDQYLLPDSSVDYTQNTSAFTNELPPEAKMFMTGMTGMNVNDSFNPHWYGQDWSDMGQGQMYHQTYEQPMKMEQEVRQQVQQEVQPEAQPEAQPEFRTHYDENNMMNWDPSVPPPIVDDSWKSFLNENPYESDEK